MYVDITVHFLFRFYSGTYVLKPLTRITMHLNPYFSKILVILQYNLCTHIPPPLHPDDSNVFFFLDTTSNGKEKLQIDLFSKCQTQYTPAAA